MSGNVALPCAVPLHVTNSIKNLDELFQDNNIRQIKNVEKIPCLLSKLKTEILNLTADQEMCYILCRRYLALVDKMYQIHPDRQYVHSLLSADLQRMTDLKNDLTASLVGRYGLQNNSTNLMEMSSTLETSNGLQHTPDMSIKSWSANSTSPTSSIVPQSIVGELFPIPKSLTDKMKQPSANGLTVPKSSTRSEISNSDSLKTASLIPSTLLIPPPLEGWWIQPSELYDAIMKERNILIVDIRPTAEFSNIHIQTPRGPMVLINVPSVLIVDGLSANTLGQRLDDATQKIWNRRETFEFIVLVDDQTIRLNYPGSKLEILRTSLIDWDINKQYKYTPVVLSGGIKEYINCYPSEVLNSSIYLSRHLNVELDELLDIESIQYPEANSSDTSLLKNISTRSFSDRRFPMQNTPSSEDQDASMTGRKSGVNLAGDTCQEKEINRSFQNIPEQVGDDQLVPEKATIPDKQSEIDNIIQEGKSTLLREARALKPKSDHKRDISSSGNVLPRKVLKILPQDIASDSISPPTFSRSKKPNMGVLHFLGDGYTSLRNIKNNCYMNTMLQCLKVVPLMKQIFVTTNWFEIGRSRSDSDIKYQVAASLQDLWRGTDTNRRTSDLSLLRQQCGQLKRVFKSGNHEDTFEFFIFLLQVLIKDTQTIADQSRILTEVERMWYRTTGGIASDVMDIFYFQVKNRRSCKKCGRSSTNYDLESSLMLPLLDGPCNLQEMINEYLNESPIMDFACVGCKTIGSLIHKKEITSYPPTLVIVLKRYKISNRGTIVKNTSLLDFPLTNLKFGNEKYKLYAIPQHLGDLHCGHYFATVLLDEAKGKFVVFNDDIIKDVDEPVNRSKLVKAQCAGFFYIRL